MAPDAPRPVKQPSTAKVTYLVVYNFISAILWATVLGRTVLIAGLRSPALVAVGVSTFLRWTQTLAALEILHSLFGIVRTPFFTTVIQVASRYVLVWGVVYLFPQLAAHRAYMTMVVAWSITEVIRYSYFALSIVGSEWDAFTWLRYSTFLVLYPIGITSECRMMLLAIEPARELHPMLPWVLYAILGIYVPGSYILYTHMMAQRRKVLGRLAAMQNMAMASPPPPLSQAEPQLQTDAAAKVKKAPKPEDKKGQ